MFGVLCFTKELGFDYYKLMCCVALCTSSV